jgi:hypothetical protein
MIELVDPREKLNPGNRSGPGGEPKDQSGVEKNRPPQP